MWRAAVLFAGPATVGFYCREVPTTGPNSAPLPRPLMTISRLYVNPATGVGPDPATLVPFKTVLLTPKGVAASRSLGLGVSSAQLPDESSSTSSAQLRDESPPTLSAQLPDVSSSIAGVMNDVMQQGRVTVPGVNEAGGPATAESESTQQPNRKGAAIPAILSRAGGLPVVSNGSTPVGPSLGSMGVQGLPEGLPRIAQKAVQVLQADGQEIMWQPGKLPAGFTELAGRHKPPICSAQQSSSEASSSVPMQSVVKDPCVKSIVGMSQCTPKGSADVCCAYVQDWSASGCWCSASGQQLLGSMPTSMTPVLLQLLGWVCE
jgi:hypothetical protein